MSEERITLELLGARVMALTAEVHDLRDRMVAFEARLDMVERRLDSLDRRMAVLESRMNRLIDLVVRIAERIEAPRG